MESRGQESRKKHFKLIAEVVKCKFQLENKDRMPYLVAALRNGNLTIWSVPMIIRRKLECKLQHRIAKAQRAESFNGIMIAVEFFANSRG